MRKGTFQNNIWWGRVFIFIHTKIFIKGSICNTNDHTDILVVVVVGEGGGAIEWYS